MVHAPWRTPHITDENTAAGHGAAAKWNTHSKPNGRLP